MPNYYLSPPDMKEDEITIRRGYESGSWLYMAFAAAPFVVAYYADTKWVIATGVAGIIYLAHETGGRLYDLCIRLRRTNILLSERDLAN